MIIKYLIIAIVGVAILAKILRADTEERQIIAISYAAGSLFLLFYFWVDKKIKNKK